MCFVKKKHYTKLCLLTSSLYSCKYVYTNISFDLHTLKVIYMQTYLDNVRYSKRYLLQVYSFTCHSSIHDTRLAILRGLTDVLVHVEETKQIIGTVL